MHGVEGRGGVGGETKRRAEGLHIPLSHSSNHMFLFREFFLFMMGWQSTPLAHLVVSPITCTYRTPVLSLTSPS